LKQEQEIGRDVYLEPCVELRIGRDAKKAWVTPHSLRGFKLNRVLGSGTSGTVFDSETRHHDDVAIKAQFASPDFKKECDLVRHMSQLGVCPRYVKAWEDEGVGFLATEKWDMSLWDWIKTYKINRAQGYPLPKRLISKLGRLINVMHQNGYVHGDIMEKNIMLDLDEKGVPIDICLTDFGLTVKKKDWKDNLDFLKVLFDYHMSDCNYTNRYFQEQNIKFADVAIDPTHLDKALLYYMKTRSR
jgi:tRNA A-37 threonylcarbamoyl transferase component Bud32